MSNIQEDGARQSFLYGPMHADGLVYLSLIIDKWFLEQYRNTSFIIPMTQNRQSDRETMMQLADNIVADQPRQMDFFSHQEMSQISDPLESALYRYTQEHTEFINECVKFFNDYDWEQTQSRDELKAIIDIILSEQNQFIGKLKTVLDTYIREKHTNEPFFKTYSQDIWRTFHLLPSKDIQRYLIKVDFADDVEQAISSDWSNVFGDLCFSFKKEYQKHLEREE